MDNDKDANRLIAINLKRLRKEAGLSTEELAKMSGISKRYLYRIQTYQGSAQNVTVSTLQDLAKALNIHITEFFWDPSAVYVPNLKFENCNEAIDYAISILSKHKR